MPRARSHSLYYGRPSDPHPYRTYRTEELLRDIASPSCDDATRAALQAEVDRRAARAASRKPRISR
jgi:hypothetical protein